MGGPWENYQDGIAETNDSVNNGSNGPWNNYIQTQEQQKEPDIQNEIDRDFQLSSPKPSPLNMSDMLKMSALGNDQESQQAYLKTKFKFAEPTPDGKSFLVGDDPNNLQPIHPGDIGDKALSTLASVASMIPSIGGQIAGAEAGAVMGSAGGPAGAILGGLVGAGVGAAGGEAIKNKMAGMNPQKAATDNLISGIFGAGGQALGSVINFGAKNYLAPKVASALDAAVDNPNKNAFLAKALKFISGVDPKETMAAQKWGGFRDIAENKEAWLPDSEGIDNIGKDVSKDWSQRLGLAKVLIDKEENKMLGKYPNAQIDNSETLPNILREMEKSSIITTSEGYADGEGMRFSFRDNLPNSLKNSDTINFLKSMGAVDMRDGTFSVPERNMIGLRDAVNAKKIWGNVLNNKNFDSNLSRIFKTALYGEGPSPLYPNGFKGLRSAINDFAENNGHSSYVLANKNFNNLMNVSDKLQSLGADVENPKSMADFLRGINKSDQFKQDAISNLKQEIGGDFDKRAGQWAVAEAMRKAQPQVLRLGVISGLLGLVTPGDALSRELRVPMAFALGSPGGSMMMARASEGISDIASKNLGNKMLLSIANKTSSKTGKAVLSQLLAKKSKQ